VSSNTLRRNVLPIAPDKFNAAPTIYTTEDITLTWSGTAVGTSPLKQYIIQRAESSDNKTWANWQTIMTVSSAETSGSATVSPTRTIAVYTRYRICVIDALDCISEWHLLSNSVYSQSRPFAPNLKAPKADSITFNKNPRVLVQTVNPPGAKDQTVLVKALDGDTYNSVDDSEMFTISGTATEAIKTIFTNPTTNPGNYSVSAHCKTVDIGPIVSARFTVAASPFTERIAAVMPVKASHISELREAVNTVRNYYSLPAFQWAQAVTAGRTNIAFWPYHILELRTAIQEVLTLLAEYGEVIQITWLNVGRGRPRADVMNQLQDVILGI
jgi:hypothetical protein